jgi:prevent-host-death family protein
MKATARHVTVHEAKTHLSRLLEQVERGQEIVVSRGRTPVARIIPVDRATQGGRRFGALRGQVVVGPEFFDPLSERELKRWGV